MGINIKRSDVCEAIRDASQLSGHTQTDVVGIAVMRYLEDFDQESRKEEAQQLLDTLWASIDSKGITLDTDELYDAQGLPA
ncbi:MAG: type II toxin-antitoxin system VapB family antitoxin [Actinomycetaceae bacterium]|nr:type II toxin-antitoxin system VapB family antitoxin [Actinomycetaceae bacterium]